MTIKKIAALAGVSRGTVDRVLNNRPYVKAETREGDTADDQATPAKCEHEGVACFGYA